MKIDLSERFSIVMLNCAFTWGNITDKTISAELTRDKGSTSGSVRARKTLLPAASGQYVNLLSSALSKFYTYHKERTVSSTVDGQRMFPNQFYLDYMSEYGLAQAEVESAFLSLEENYAASVQAAAGLLQGAFNADDYPDVSELRRYLSFRVRFLPMPASNQIVKTLGEAAAYGVDEYIEEAVKAATEDARSRLKLCVKKMAEKLSDPKAVYRDTLTENLDDVVRLLPALNVADDADLNNQIQIAKDTLSGLDPEHLRKNMHARASVASAANELLRKMGG